MATSAHSQSATPSAREEVYRKLMDFPALVKGGRVAPNWLPDGSSFWYAEGGPQNTVIQKVDPASNAVTPLFDVSRLREALADDLGYEPPDLGVPFRTFEFKGPDEVGFEVEGNEYRLNLRTYRLSRQFPLAVGGGIDLDYLASERDRVTPRKFWKDKFMLQGRAQQPEKLSPDGKWFVSVRNNNVYLRATVDGRYVPLTNDGDSETFWDVETVQWDPWSPNSLQLAVVEQHTAGMARVPTIKWLKPLEEGIDNIIAIQGGGVMNRAELFLVDIVSKQPMAIDLGETKDKYLVILGWLPDGSEVLVAHFTRVLDRVDIRAVSARTGKVRTLMTETSKTFVRNTHQIWTNNNGLLDMSLGFNLLPRGDGFIWASERDGWKHLYLYDMNGKLVRQLTQGEFPISRVERIDQANGWVYFTAHGDSSRPYDKHLYRVSLQGRGFQQLTEGKGQHEVSIAPSSQFFVDTYSSVDVPPRTVLRRADGKLLKTLSEADIGRLKQAGWVSPKEYVVKAADGKTDLWVTMLFPYDFDPSKKYPVVENIYGGPMVTVRPMAFYESRNHLDYAMVNLGFVVVSLDARGTPKRSKAFQDVVFRSWGVNEIPDHAAAIKQLGERYSFMDLDRVGIYGASWGGQFAFRAMTQAPELYKVGVSIVPGFDPYEGFHQESYLGMPLDNKEAYVTADAFHLADRLKGKLMMIGGMNDVVTQKGLFKMSQLLIDLGIQHEMMVYPEAGHGTQGKTSRFHDEFVKNYFVRHLQP